MNTTRRSFIAQLSCIAGAFGLGKKVSKDNPSPPSEIRIKAFMESKQPRAMQYFAKEEISAGQCVMITHDGHAAKWSARPVVGVALCNSNNGIVTVI